MFRIDTASVDTANYFGQMIGSSHGNSLESNAESALSSANSSVAGDQHHASASMSFRGSSDEPPETRRERPPPASEDRDTKKPPPGGPLAALGETLSPKRFGLDERTKESSRVAWLRQDVAGLEAKVPAENESPISRGTGARDRGRSSRSSSALGGRHEFHFNDVAVVVTPVSGSRGKTFSKEGINAELELANLRSARVRKGGSDGDLIRRQLTGQIARLEPQIY